MKTVSLIVAFLCVQSVCFARDTAYQALRVAGGGDNQALLNHVIEVDGVKGDPQPSTWRILVNDPNARGGVRELEVSNGRVISEHTPVRSYVGVGGNEMDFKRLNLDSQGAFTIANQEASKRHAGFDSVNYALRSDEQGAPVWILKLIDDTGATVGTVYIAADNGAVVRTEGFAGTPGHPVVQDTYTPSDTAANPSPVPQDGNGDQPPNGKGPGYQINKGFHRLGADLQQFFTGKRTWDQKFQDDQ